MFETFYAKHRVSRAQCTMPSWAYCLSWKQQQQDQQDARLMATYMHMRRVVNVRARMMILSGLAGGRA